MGINNQSTQEHAREGEGLEKAFRMMLRQRKAA